MQVGWLANADLIPDIRSKGLNIVIFSNNRRQKSRPIHRSISIGAEPHFQGSNFLLSMENNLDLNLNLSKFVNFVKNFLHVIWSISTISNGCPPLSAPQPPSLNYRSELRPWEPPQTMEILPPSLAHCLPALRSPFSHPLPLLWGGGSLRTHRQGSPPHLP